MNRQQQPQHLRQQLQEVLPLQTTIPSQSCVEDTNSNASSQSHTLARYPKPHLNITNEISGKNNLLTSSKTLSPVSKKLNVNEEYCFDKNDANSRKDSELNSKLNESEELLNDESEARKKAKAVKQCLQNKRSFLAGLISARKRRSKESYRLRRKGKRKIRNVQPSGFCWKLYDSGLSQGIKKPDAITDSTESVGGNSIKATEAVGKDFASRDSNVLSRLACDDEKVETEDMKNLKPNFKKSIRLKMKRINVEKLKLTDSDSTVRVCKCNTKGNSDECKTCKKFLFDEPFDSVKSDDKAAEPKERILKTENTDSIRISLEEKSLLERKRNREGKAEQENSVKAGENKGPEKPEPEKEIRIEINANNLPKSFVLLENVCRKDIGIKCVNVSKRGNDENGRNVQKNIETGPIREKNVRRGKREGKGNRKSNSRKRVRFENAVMEKWINVDEGDECDRAKIISNETDSQSREGRREERKKKLTKGQVVEYLTEKEANQIERLDDSSREENSLPHNNSGLGEFSFAFLQFSVSISLK